VIKKAGEPDQTLELKKSGNEWSAVFRPYPDLKREYSLEFYGTDSAGNVASSTMQANLFQIVVVGLLTHIFAGVLLVVFLYWAYTRTIKKHKAAVHYESYHPETFGEKLEKWWFGLTKRKPKHFQKKLE
jgi:hypothetical protein